MNLLNPGVRYVIITDPTNEQSVVISGNDIAPSSTLEKEVLGRGMSSAGTVTHLNVKWGFSLQFADKDAFDTLNALPRQSTYQFTIVKMNGFVFWGEDQALLIDEALITDPESEDYPYTLRMNDIWHNPDIREVANGAAPLVDSDGDGFIDGFTLNGTNTGQSFTGGVQSITTINSVEFYKRLVLPVPGLNLKYSLDVEDAPISRYIRYATITGSEISVDSGTYSTLGVKTRDITLPANVFYVDVGVRCGNNFDSTTSAFSKLSLQTLSFDFVNY